MPGEGANQLVQFVDESQRIDVLQQEFSGVVEAFAVGTVLLDVGEYGLQEGFHVGEALAGVGAGFAAAQFVAFQKVGYVAVRIGDGAVGQSAEPCTGTFCALVEIGVVKSGIGNGFYGFLSQGLEALLVGAVLCGHLAVNVSELVGVQLLECGEVAGGVLFEKLFGQRFQAVVDAVALVVFHAAFGKFAQHFGQLFLPFGAGEVHEFVHGVLNQVGRVEIDVESHG